MKNTAKILLLLLMVQAGFAQDFKLGNVTKAELEEKTHPKDASAPAAVLFSRCTNFMNYSDNNGFELVTEVEMKIKIYTKDGYEFANKNVQIYNSETEKERIDVSKAYTYNLVNGKVEKVKLKSEGEFMEEVNKNWKRKKIMMPDVKEGSIVEYKYTIISPFYSVMPDWRFQEPIPVNFSTLVTRIPEYYVYSPSFRGYYSPKVTKTSKPRSIIINSKERTVGRVAQTTFSSDKIDFSENVITYELADLPALKDESFVSNIDNYASGIEHELSMVNFPNQPVKPYSTTWEDVAKTIYKYDDFGPELNKTGYFDDDIKALIAPLKTQEEKLGAIFSYVRSTMNWNDMYGYSCRDGVKKAYKEKTGNVAEINLMLTAMMRYAGFEADPVLVCTRSQKVPLFPSRSAYNYVVCGVKQGDKIVLLDATSKYSTPGVLPSRALNWKGRLIQKEGNSTEIDLSPSGLSREITNISVKFENTDKCTGRIRTQFSDNNALSFRENTLSASKESLMEKKEKKHSGLEVNELKFTNEKDLAKPIMEEYGFSYNNATETLGDKLYINPMVFFAQKENPFKSDKREYPIDFVYPQEDKYTISLTLPEGYTVESLPANYAMSMEENIGSFKYAIQQQGNTVQLMVTLSINYPLVPASYYDTVKSFFGKVVEKETEKIVLKKA